MNGRLEGKRALVTGSTQGLGVGIARRFAAEIGAAAFSGAVIDLEQFPVGSFGGRSGPQTSRG